jgi:N-acetylglucosamine repressor
MFMREPQLLAGVNVGFNSIHTIIVREEADGRLRLMGEDRNRRVVERDQITLIRRVRESIEKALENAHELLTEILVIGVAAPGQIDIENGLMLFSPHFHVQEYPFPLVEKLREHVDTRHITLINNDDAHGIGEQRIGEGKEIKDLVHIRIGYNVGAGIIINEQLYTGADNLAGAFGHMVVDLNGPECDCGNHGCLETFVSREAIAKKLLQRYREGVATVLAKRLEQEPLDINSAIIADAIDQEDVLASRVVEEAAEILGIGIANVINFLNPHRIILGGDVVNEIDLFFERAVASARERALHANKRNVSIVRGRLGTTAAAYGAAVFAKEQLLRQEA